jgi:hypothetical protein
MTEIPPPDNSRQICPKCNSPIIHGTNFCESCGSPLLKVLQVKLPAAPDEVVTPPLSPPAENISPMAETQKKVTGILPPELSFRGFGIPGSGFCSTIIRNNQFV